MERAARLGGAVAGPFWSAEGQAYHRQVDIQTQRCTALDTGRSDEHQRPQPCRCWPAARTGQACCGRAPCGRKQYVEAMERHDLTLALGQAGTGKTFLAVVQAVQLPATSARWSGSSSPDRRWRPVSVWAFYPVICSKRSTPTLRPLYDALHMPAEPRNAPAALIEKNIIEVAPLAYMRGRTLAEAFVILDEAQNTTPAQMRMVLTRLGENSRMVVTGDPSARSDLPRQPAQWPGGRAAKAVLDGVEGIAICRIHRC